MVDEKEIREEMKNWFGISLTPKQATFFLNKCVEECGVLDCGFDTVARDYVSDFIALEVTGMHWPLGGDSDEYSKNFFQKLIANANKHKYTIDANRYSEYLPKIKLRF